MHRFLTHPLIIALVSRDLCCRFGCFLRLWLRYEPQNSHQATHDWTYNIEETERKVDQCRDAEHSALRHAACRPWHQYGSDRGRVLCGAAEQFRSIATFRILIVIDRNVHDD